MKKPGCLVIFLLVAVCASMVVNLSLLAVLGVQESSGLASVDVLRQKRFNEEVLVEGAGSKIAVIPLDGIIAFGSSGSLGGFDG